MKVHRAVTLVLMILVALVCFALITSRIVSTFDGRSLVALLVVVGLSGVGGVAFSWRRYRGGGPSRTAAPPRDGR